MLQLSSQDFREIQAWFHRNARPLELAIWKHQYEGGPSEDILAALRWYQNEDGGFGQALEPDNWNPASSPYGTLQAIHILLDIPSSSGSRTASLAARYPDIIGGVFRYLEGSVHFRHEGWAFSVPGNNDFPHAPWWSWTQAAETDGKDAMEGIGITAELCSFLLQEAVPGSPLHDRALALSSLLLSRLHEDEAFGDMGLGGFCILLEALRTYEPLSWCDIPTTEERLRHLVQRAIVRDPEQWVHYCVRPSDLIRNSGSIFHAEQADIVQTELDWLIETRPSGSVWGIPWSWFDNNERYPKEFAISENWWRAIKALEKLRFLTAFGRLSNDIRPI